MDAALDVYNQEIVPQNQQCYLDWSALLPTITTAQARTVQLSSSPDDIVTPFSDTSTLSSVSASYSPIQAQWPLIASLDATPIQSTATTFLDFVSDLDGQTNLDEAFRMSAPELVAFMELLSLNGTTPQFISPDSSISTIFPAIPFPLAVPELPPPAIPLHYEGEQPKPQLKQPHEGQQKPLHFADLPDSFVSDMLAADRSTPIDENQSVTLTMAQLSSLIRTAAATRSPSSLNSSSPDSPLDDPRRRRKPTSWYKCEHCDAKFTRKYNYSIHLETHKVNRERTFVCTVPGCGSAFHRANELDRHMAGKHGMVVEKKGARKGSVYNKFG